MTYTVERHHESGNVDLIARTTSEREARTIANTSAKDGRGQVYIAWFRTTDGQHGYVNRDGHDPVGRAW